MCIDDIFSKLADMNGDGRVDAFERFEFECGFDEDYEKELGILSDDDDDLFDDDDDYDDDDDEDEDDDSNDGFYMFSNNDDF